MSVDKRPGITIAASMSSEIAKNILQFRSVSITSDLYQDPIHPGYSQCGEARGGVSLRRSHLKERMAYRRQSRCRDRNIVCVLVRLVTLWKGTHHAETLKIFWSF